MLPSVKPKRAGYSSLALSAEDEVHVEANDAVFSEAGSVSTPVLPQFSCSFTISTLLFTWFTPLIEKSNQIDGMGGKTIKDSMFALPENWSSRKLYEKLIACWTYEDLKLKLRHTHSAATASPGSASGSNIFGRGYMPSFTGSRTAVGFSMPESPPRPQLWRVLHTMIFAEFWFCGLCRLISDCAVIFGTILIKEIIVAAEVGDSERTFFLACMILANSVVQALMLQQFIAGSFNCGSQVVSASTAAVYHASLSLRLHQLDPPRTLAEINNIQSKDASSLREFVVFFHNLWACPMMIVACAIFLTYLLGWAGLVCFALICLLLPVESHIAKKAKAVRERVLLNSDKRMNLVNEIIDGIWTVKLSGICPVIYEKVTNVRREELAEAWQSILIEMLNIVLTRSSTILITLITFAVYCALAGGTQQLSADKAFSALALINIVGRPIQVIPKCISIWSDAMVSMNRIDILLSQGRDFNPSLLDYSSLKNNQCLEFPRGCTGGGDGHPREQVELSRAVSTRPSISLSNVTSIRYPHAVKVLSNVSLSLQGTGLVLVVGGNAAGKSSLLTTMLHELRIIRGSVWIDAHYVAYCGHDSWIVNKSVKANILLGCPPAEGIKGETGTPHNSCEYEEQYQQAVDMCALRLDIDSWPDRHGTIIGEKGINISGGQKQRICLARAVCSQADVLVLDSVMSGLDIVVSKHIFSQCIQPLAKERLVVMTTHHLELLPFASTIVVMERGQARFVGSYEQFQDQEIHVQGLPASASLAIISSSSEAAATVQGASGSDASAKLDGKSTKLTVTTSSIDSLPPATAQTAIPSFSQAPALKDDLLMKRSNWWGVYVRYLRAGGVLAALCAVLLSLSAYGAGALGDYQLALWTDEKYTAVQYLVIYASISAMTIILHFSRIYCLFLCGITASRSMHDTLLESILGAKISFFHSTPSGRVSSRFSVDMDTIDFSIPPNVSSFLDAALGIFTGLGVVIINSPFYVIAVIPLAWQYMRTQALYRAVSKELKTLDSAAKAPFFSHFRETLGGLETIRGYGIEYKLLAEHHHLLDVAIQTRLNWDAANRWLGIRLDLIGSFIVSLAAFSLVYASSNAASGGTAGLMLSYALKATQSLSFAIRSSTALENMFISAERVFDYIDVDQETSTNQLHKHGSGSEKLHKKADPMRYIEAEAASAEAATRSSLHLPDAEGDIEMATAASGDSANCSSSTVALRGKKIQVRYAYHLPPVLTGVDFSLHRGKLVGVCGRSGSGKSTLSLVLSRAISDLEGGHLWLNAKNSSNSSASTSFLDVEQVPLGEYRAMVAVYPQDSFIFSGTLRDYLDPMGEHSDAALKLLLRELSQAVNSTSQHELATDGSTSSLGEIDSRHWGEVGYNIGISDSIDAGDNLSLGSCQSATREANGRAGTSPPLLPAEMTVLQLEQEITSGGGNLSAGEKQVAVLARAALSNATHVVVLDEITSNLDRQVAARALRVLKQYLTNRSCPPSGGFSFAPPIPRPSNSHPDLAVVLIAHNMHDIMACDEVWVVDQGRIVDIGTPDELIAGHGSVDGQPTLFQQMWASREHEHAR